VRPCFVTAPISTFHANIWVCYTNLHPFPKLHALKSENLSSRYVLKMSHIIPNHGMYIYIYIYIKRERERERDWLLHSLSDVSYTPSSKYISTYSFQFHPLNMTKYWGRRNTGLNELVQLSTYTPMILSVTSWYACTYTFYNSALNTASFLGYKGAGRKTWQFSS
jgi:hypothetical protein